MKVPVIRGVIDRRILANYRIDPEALSRILPPPFRPKLVGGFGIAGICLIRLKEVRPTGLPAAMGVSSENAAHRIAVEWEEDGALREGVYVPRRDTSSRLNTWAGGRLFPGEQHLADFRVEEDETHYEVALKSRDGQTHLLVKGHLAKDLPKSSVFGSLAEASDFFAQGSLGYSLTKQEGRLDGMELKCLTWEVHPLEVERVESSFFADQERFPPGSVVFDCALLMKGIEHEWHARDSLCA